jgi:Mg2+ and Co2+ transporter CorA
MHSIWYAACIFPMTLVISIFCTCFKNVPIYTTAGFVAMILILVALVAGILAVSRRQGWI